MTTYGDMSPEERRNARRTAVAQLNAELNHPAMRAALAADVHTYTTCSHRSDYASQAEHDRDCPSSTELETGAPVWTKISPDLWTDQYDNLIERRAGVTDAGFEYWGYGPRGSMPSTGTGRKIVRIARTIQPVKDDLECQSPALRALIALRAELEAKHPEDRELWGPLVNAVERSL